MQILDEFKRDRLEEFDKKFGRGYGFSKGASFVVREDELDDILGIKEIRAYISETIDLMDQRTKQIVDEVIGEDIRYLDPPEGMRIRTVTAQNKLRSEQRLCARTLLDHSTKENTI